MIRLYKIYLALNQHGCGKPTMSSSFSYETNHWFFNRGFSTFPGWDVWTLCASSRGGVSTRYDLPSGVSIISCSEKMLDQLAWYFYLLLVSLLVYIQIVYTICSNSWWSSSNRPSICDDVGDLLFGLRNILMHYMACAKKNRIPYCCKAVPHVSFKHKMNM